MRAPGPPFPLSLLEGSMENFSSVRLLTAAEHNQCNAPGANRNLLSCQFSIKQVKLCAETRDLSLCHTVSEKGKRTKTSRGGANGHFQRCGGVLGSLFASAIIFLRQRNLSLQVAFSSAYPQAAAAKCYEFIM